MREMTRNLKVFALALFAVCAMGALAGSVAQATEFFHSHKEKTILTGEAPFLSEQVLTIVPGVSLRCEIARLRGTEVGTKSVTTFTTETITLHPEYERCNLSGAGAIVRTRECHFKLFAATTETSAFKPMGNLEIGECPSFAPIEIEVPAFGITIVIENQLIFHAIRYENNKSGSTEEWDVKAATTAGTEGKGEAGKPTGIKWKCSPKASCKAGFGTSEGTEATYTGEITLKGFADLNVGFEGVTGVYEEGNQTGIWKGPAE